MTSRKGVGATPCGRAGRFMDVELQQRAVEYLNLEMKPELAAANVTAMPPWEKRKSLLLRRMAEREVGRSPPHKALPWTVHLAKLGLGCTMSACQREMILPTHWHVVSSSQCSVWTPALVLVGS